MVSGIMRWMVARKPSSSSSNVCFGDIARKKRWILFEIVSPSVDRRKTKEIKKMSLKVAAKAMVILSGKTHPQLAADICQRLDMKPTEIQLFHAGNKETMIQLTSSVRFKDCYIVQTATHTNVNDAIMELLLMGYTCHTSACRRLIGVIPYLPYGKQARQRKRSCIPARLLAKLICKAGFHHIITVDLHHKEIQGFFDIPVENLRASPFLLNHIRESLQDNQIGRDQVVIVATHSSVVRKATAYAHRLQVDLAILHGTEDNPSEMDEIDGRSSPPPPVKTFEFVPGGETLPMLTNLNPFPLKLVGDVRGKLAIMVDNIIDDVQQAIRVANFLKQCEDAKQVSLVATHALFSPEAARKLCQSEIDEIVVTNTIPHELQSMECPKIKTIDVSLLLTEAIRRLHNNESLSYLFTEVSLDD